MKYIIVNAEGKAFTSASSYDRPTFTKTARGTKYVTEAEAMSALEKLRKYGTFGVSIKKVKSPNALTEFQLNARADVVTDDDVDMSDSDEMQAAEEDPEGVDSDADDQEEEEQAISPRELAMTKQLAVTYGKKRAAAMTKPVKEDENYDTTKAVAVMSKSDKKIRDVAGLVKSIDDRIKELEASVKEREGRLETAEGNTEVTALSVAKQIKRLLQSKDVEDFLLLQILVNSLGTPIMDRIPEQVRFYAQSGGRSFENDIVRPEKTEKKDPVNENALNEVAQLNYRIRVRGKVQGDEAIGAIGKNSVKIGGSKVDCDSFDVNENTKVVTIMCSLTTRKPDVSVADIERTGVTVNGRELEIINITVSEGREL